MANATIIAKQAGLDSTWSGQWERLKHKPLKADIYDITNFGSMKGRVTCLKELAHTVVREPYRAFKNLDIILMRVLDFVRAFFETLFREDGTSWKQLGTQGKNLISCAVALPTRAVTYVHDLALLGLGLVHPRVAIHADKPHVDNSGELGGEPILV